MSPITVLIAAGLLPQLPAKSTNLYNLETILTDMSPQGQEEIFVIAKVELDLERRNSQKKQS